MYDMVRISEIIKKMALDAVESRKPLELFTGTVLSTKPLLVKVDNNLELTEKQLMIPESLTDRYVDMELEELEFEDAYINGQGSNIKMNKILSKVYVKNGLRENDKILMLRIEQGQKFLVLERVVSE